MKFKYFAVALLALVAMSRPVFADQREDAYALVKRWADAFNSGDVEKIVGMYTTDALVFDPFNPGLVSKPDDLRAMLKRSVSTKSQIFLGEHSTLVLSTDAVVIVVFYDLSAPDLSAPNADAKPFGYQGRSSFVLVKKGDLWQIAHQHSSRRPKT